MPLGAYVRFAAANLRFVSFGFVAALASSFGQTYFVGVFGPSLQSEFDLSHTAWGLVYLIGTLASAAVLPFTGRQIDVRDLRHYAGLVALLLAIGCLVTSLTTGVAMLCVAVFLLRQGGQGLMTHVAITSMARYFTHNRGRAIAVASLGFGVGEAILPLAAVLAISEIGWRWTYAGVAIAVACIILPLLQWLLVGHGERHLLYVSEMSDAAARAQPAPRSWTRAEVVRDVRFYLLLPGLLAPALVITALFFHHLSLADAKGWSHTWITGSYVVFAASGTFTSLVCGPLIDKIGGTRLVPAMLVPITAGLLVVASLDHPMTVVAYFILIGSGVGISHTAVAAMWAEVYGPLHIGAIRSLVSALAVFSSALGPILMGSLMDLGVSIERICVGLSGYCVFGAVLIAIALRNAGRDSSAVS